MGKPAVSRVIDVALDGEWMPGESEEPLGFDSIDRDFGRHAGVRLLSLGHLSVRRRRDDDASLDRARYERPIELHAVPLAKFLSVGDRPPHPGARRAQ